MVGVGVGGTDVRQGETFYREKRLRRVESIVSEKQSGNEAQLSSCSPNEIGTIKLNVS